MRALVYLKNAEHSWNDWQTRWRCPVCGTFKDNGHATKCQLDAAIQELENFLLEHIKPFPQPPELPVGLSYLYQRSVGK